MNVLLLGIILLVIYLAILCLIAQIKKDNSFGNFAWGGGVLLLTWYTFFITDYHAPRQIIITLLITLWALRLGIYFYSRYKKGADPRFSHWQATHSIFGIILSCCWIIILHGIQSIVMALPSTITNLSILQPMLSLFDYAVIAIWFAGFFIESIADYQLYYFMKHKKNDKAVMQQGLWHYSRHPNYFGEIVMWWCIFLLALPVPYGWITIIAPITITILLLFITGIPLIEKAMAKNPAYQAYKERTNMLIPWFVKK